MSFQVTDLAHIRVIARHNTWLHWISLDLVQSTGKVLPQSELKAPVPGGKGLIHHFSLFQVHVSNKSGGTIMSGKKMPRQGGLWDSPFSPLSVARGLTISDVAWSQDGILAWREVRSGWGAIVLQEQTGQAPRELNSDYSIQAKVGYGGGDFTLGSDQVYFAEEKSGRLFRQPIAGGSATPITPGFGKYAAPILSPDSQWIIFVHTYEDRDNLGIVDSRGAFWPQLLASGDDFYMQPTWHPKGEKIAWVAWNHPNMPWDGTTLHLGDLTIPKNSLPRLNKMEIIAGDSNISIFQPQFSPDSRHLAYVSDTSGWWQIYIYDLQDKSHRQLTSVAADHGQPAWTQGLRTYGFTPDGKNILVTRNQQGFGSLWRVDIESGEEVRLPLSEEYNQACWLEQIAVTPQYSLKKQFQVALIASGPQSPPRVISVNFPNDWGKMLRPEVEVKIQRRATAEELSPQDYAPAEPTTWHGFDDQPVHGLLFSPTNSEFSPKGKPPLIVNIHGGPTSQVRARFNPSAQFFATRGYTFLEVNHRGSTGYGRAYWEVLNGKWGIYDVEDAMSGAQHLVEQGYVDGSRLVIMGGSAGGFTVLQALVDHPGFFKAGVCLYGVANQFTLAAETHKFEARYSDKLLGPLPEAAAIYRNRSPIFFAEKISDPLIIFQGEEDRVVPRAQSDAIVASLQRRGISYEYHLYPGEGHGFRKLETIEHFYKATEKFLRTYVIYA
jgi:dipeptidyl aminopeptidase/acylaminoacyl peptidase